MIFKVHGKRTETPLLGVNVKIVLHKINSWEDRAHYPSIANLGPIFVISLLLPWLGKRYKMTASISNITFYYENSFLRFWSGILPLSYFHCRIFKLPERR